MVLHWVQNLDNQRSQEVKEGEADLFGTLHRAVDAPPLANGETRIAPPRECVVHQGANQIDATAVEVCRQCQIADGLRGRGAVFCCVVGMRSHLLQMGSTASD